MPVEFTKCEQCGLIFANPGGEEVLCSKCRQVEPESISSRELLRKLRNLLRDFQVQGAFLTIPELAEKAAVSEERVWHFIHTGELDTASFNDPEVRDFVVKKRKEMLKSRVNPSDTGQSQPGTARPKTSGFHLRVEDDKDK
jgi:hypothetical protein